MIGRQAQVPAYFLIRCPRQVASAKVAAMLVLPVPAVPVMRTLLHRK